MSAPESPPSRWDRWAPRLLLALASLVALGWAVYALAGDALAAALGDRLGGAVRAVTDGKIRDARPFALHRLRDALVIGTAVVALWGLNRLAVPRLSRGRWAWLPLGALFFLEANVLLAVLARTGLFWLAMYAGDAGRHDVTRFYVREAIATDLDADLLVGVIGNSQAGTQIDEDRINEALGDRLTAAQLNFPAAKPYSLLLLQDAFERADTDALVLYVSEISFLRGATLEHLPLFASPGGMRDFAALGGDPEWDPMRVRNGRLASVLPAYRYRSLLAQRVLGKPERPPARMPASGAAPGVADGDVPPPEALDDGAFEEAPEADAPEASGDELEARLQRRYDMLIFGDEVAFQYRAMAEFARRADAAGVDLYLLPGTVHPGLARRIPAEYRAEMVRFLRALADEYPRVHYVEESRLPVLGPADFKDAAHASRQGQATFTDGLIEVLRADLLGETPVMPDSARAPEARPPEASGDTAARPRR